MFQGGLILDKLNKVLKVRKQHEKVSAQVLAERQQARQAAEKQQQDLADLAADYRKQHVQVTQTNANHFLQFQRFYEQLNAAVEAQEQVVARNVELENLQSDEYIARHRERRALEELLLKRDLAHKTEQIRRSRRAQNPTHKRPLD